MRQVFNEKSVTITMKVEPVFKEYLLKKAEEKKVSLTEYITKKVAPEYFQKQIENIIHP